VLMLSEAGVPRRHGLFTDNADLAILSVGNGLRPSPANFIGAEQASAALIPVPTDYRRGKALMEMNNRSGRPGKGRNPIDA